MFSHMVIGSNDLDRSKRFYDATFGALGAVAGTTDAKGRLVYVHKGNRLLITKPLDGAAATPGNGMTLGLAMDSCDQAAAWHKAGVANGGTSVEDAPGVRDMGSVKLYLAYLRDPDGNKLCAVCRNVA